MVDTPANFDPIKIAKDVEDEIASKAGYRSSEYKWFGSSVPNEIVSICQMCDAPNRTSREDAIKHGISQTCQSCKRQAIRTCDHVFWENYLKLNLGKYELFMDQFDEPMLANTTSDGVRRIYPIKSEYLRSNLALSLKNRAAVDQAILYMSGLARRAGIKHNLDLRVTKYADDIWIDVCNDKWEAIRVNKSGWGIEAIPPIIFKRYSHMLPFIVDKSGTKKDYDAYLKLLNFQSENAKLLYSGFITGIFYQNTDMPIIVFTGAQGAAKSSASVATRLVVDPSALPVFNLNKDEDELPQKILHHFLPFFDNCTYISQESSNLFCQASSGMGFSKRKLFTDTDDVICSVRRALGFNGITAPSMSPDFLDRATLIPLDRITGENRRDKEEIERERDLLLPKVRGYILNVLVSALNDEEIINMPASRLAGFARFADKCTTAMGYTRGEFSKAYYEANKDIAEEAVQADPLASVLLDLLDARGGWNGKVSDLLKELEKMTSINTQRAPGWPKTPQWLSDALIGKLDPGLKQLGWKCEKLPRTHSGRCIKITKMSDGGLSKW